MRVLVQNVTFGYEGHRPLLQNLSFHVAAGEFCALVGSNGCGKTTLLKLLLGLLTPQSGQILLLGRPPGQGRLDVGHMPQSILYDFQYPITVFEVVRMGLLNSPWKFFFSRQDHKKVEALLEELDLRELRDAPFHQLSGGQKQRALLARALVVGPQLLLLDEPTASIDQQSKGHFLELFCSLKARMAILMVSHDEYLVSHQVDRVICLDDHLMEHPTVPFTSLAPANFSPHEKAEQARLKIVRHHHNCNCSEEDKS